MQERRADRWIGRFLFILGGVLVLSVVLLLMSEDTWERGGLALIVSAASTLVAAFSAYTSQKQAEAARDQVEQMQQPNVVAYFDFAGREIKFEVRNIGNGPARDVKVEFQGPIPEDPWGRPLGYSQTPIRFLAPNQALAQLVGFRPPKDDSGSSEYTVVICYEDVRGRRYELKADYDLSYIETLMYPESLQGESLRAIADSLRSLAAAQSSHGYTHSFPPPPSTERSLATIAEELGSIATRLLDSNANLAEESDTDASSIS